MKDFEYYIGKGEVKKQSPDANFAASLIQDAVQRFKYASGAKPDEKSAKYIYEDIYDSLREAIDSLLALRGFKSYSHVASISFLKQFDFSYDEMDSLERMRKRRNGMKYYGKTCSVAETKAAIELAREMLRKLQKIFARMKKK